MCNATCRLRQQRHTWQTSCTDSLTTPHSLQVDALLPLGPPTYRLLSGCTVIAHMLLQREVKQQLHGTLHYRRCREPVQGRHGSQRISRSRRRGMAATASEAAAPGRSACYPADARTRRAVHFRCKDAILRSGSIMSGLSLNGGLPVLYHMALCSLIAAVMFCTLTNTLHNDIQYHSDNADEWAPSTSYIKN